MIRVGAIPPKRRDRADLDGCHLALAHAPPSVPSALARALPLIAVGARRGAIGGGAEVGRGGARREEGGMGDAWREVAAGGAVED